MLVLFNKMNNLKISIVAVNWWGNDFARLLQKTVLANTKSEFELIIVDNSGSYKSLASYMSVINPGRNLGHGAGLDLGVAKASGEYILILDIDCHLLLKDWDQHLLKIFENGDIKLACATDGELLKPAKPLAMFFKKETVIKNKISFRAVNLSGVKFDVGVHAYFRILSEYGNRAILPLPAAKTNYKDVLGSDYCLGAERFCYHEWYGTRFYDSEGKMEREKIDSMTFKMHLDSKENLFKQIQ